MKRLLVPPAAAALAIAAQATSPAHAAPYERGTVMVIGGTGPDAGTPDESKDPALMAYRDGTTTGFAELTVSMYAQAEAASS